MKAILYSKTANPHKLIVVKTEQPEPKDGEVLIKVHTVSPNAADYRSIKMGLIPKSKIFGSAVAGTVEAVGQHVSHYTIGDEVLADLTSCGFGGFAEYVTAPISALAAKPNALSFESAACLPVAATTAHNGIKKAKVQAGQHVLILGSGGGVGSYSVLLAKHYGAHVTAVCSTRNRDQALALGADEVLDYTQNEFKLDHKQYDVILAVNGNYPLMACLKKLNAGGRYIGMGGALAQIFKAMLLGPLLSLGSKKIKTLASKVKAEELEEVAQIVSKNPAGLEIQVKKGMLEIPETMSNIKAGHAQGKIVFQLNESV